MRVQALRCSGFRLMDAHRATSRQKRAWCRCRAENPEQINRLEAKLRRKQDELRSTLDELGVEAMDDKMKLAAEVPVTRPYRLAHLVQNRAEQIGGAQPGPLLLVTIVRPSESSSLPELVSLAKQYEESGADALCVPMDSDDSPSGLKDLFSITQAVKIPVVAQDWFIHPLQMMESREAGASGVLGVVACATGPELTPLLSSFAASIGLDCPVEVVNMQETDAMTTKGVPAYAVNISVGLTLSISGVSTDIAEGILQQLPFGAVSIVGARSTDEARKAREAGADIVMLKPEMIAQWQGTPKDLIEEVRYATCGDD